MDPHSWPRVSRNWTWWKSPRSTNWRLWRKQRLPVLPSSWEDSKAGGSWTGQAAIWETKRIGSQRYQRSPLQRESSRGPTPRLQTKPRPRTLNQSLLIALERAVLLLVVTVVSLPPNLWSLTAATFQSQLDNRNPLCRGSQRWRRSRRRRKRVLNWGWRITWSSLWYQLLPWWSEWPWSSGDNMTYKWIIDHLFYESKYLG